MSTYVIIATKGTERRTIIVYDFEDVARRMARGLEAEGWVVMASRDLREWEGWKVA